MLSFWQGITERREIYPSLKGKIQTEVVIIGGGITGLTAAYELTVKGKKVIILESANIGFGTSGNSTGNLYIPIQKNYQNIKSDFVAPLMHARKQTIDYIEEVVQHHQLNCNFTRRPTYLYAYQETGINNLKKEFELYQNNNIDLQDNSELPLPEPYKRVVKLPNQARFNPLSYLIELAKILKEKGVMIFENSMVTSFDPKSMKVETDEGLIIAENIVIATHIVKGISLSQLLAPPYRSYVTAVQVDNFSYPEGHFWNFDEPHYISSTHSSNADNKPDYFMVAGSHHRTGKDNHTENNFTAIKKHINKYYQVTEWGSKWSAQHYQPADGVPIIGKIPNHKSIYFATAFNADGLIFGTLAGTIIANLIVNHASESSSIFQPYRFNGVNFMRIIEEAGNTLFEFAKDFPGKVDVKNINEIRADEGKVIEIAGEKYGVYRDPTGEIHIVSVVCTHMKCILTWNQAEKTWDCPCHGSRFSIKGKVIEGPALQNLRQYKF